MGHVMLVLALVVFTAWAGLGFPKAFVFSGAFA